MDSWTRPTVAIVSSGIVVIAMCGGRGLLERECERTGVCDMCECVFVYESEREREEGGREGDSERVRV